MERRMKQDIIQITDLAATHIHDIIIKGQQENKSYIGLRIQIKKGGCSGSKYDFQYAEEKEQYEE
mgnify:CR=1 FL=1|jgi:iron-sulfur cluster assembly protein|tara:strand:- start:220 stop:414 length:195 start_codon:yes stop_codon:yes gene_type:complete